MMKLILICSLMMCSLFSRAEDVSSTTTQEIEHLLVFLENSGCQFNRNGSWHSAAEAAAHIRKKYNYLARKKMLTDTESFIKKAATESSISGKPYIVKCEGQADINSAFWFEKELAAHRETSNPKP